MSYRLVLINKRGIEFDERNRSVRHRAMNEASMIVNNGSAELVKVYSGYTRIYTARAADKY